MSDAPIANESPGAVLAPGLSLLTRQPPHHLFRATLAERDAHQLPRGILAEDSARLLFALVR